MVKVVYTRHAKKKLSDLAGLGIEVKKSLVEDIIRRPLSIDRESDMPNIIATGIISVITFYPARKGRYR